MSLMYRTQSVALVKINGNLTLIKAYFAILISMRSIKRLKRCFIIPIGGNYLEFYTAYLLVSLKVLFVSHFLSFTHREIQQDDFPGSRGKSFFFFFFFFFCSRGK